MKAFIKIFFFLFIYSSIFAQNPYENYKSKWNGKNAPDFLFNDISGKEIWLSDLKGKVVLLNFWFTTCSGCKAEYPGLQTLKKRFKNENEVDFLSISTDNKIVLTSFLQKKPLNFKHMAEGYEIAEIIYGILGYPTNFIIDQNGVIQHIKIGGSPQSADDIEYEMKHLLKQ